MSRSAVVFMLASVVSLLAGAYSTGPGADGGVLLFAGSCFAVLFLLALIRGKRIRFDSQLR